MEADRRVEGSPPKMEDRNDIFNRLHHLEIFLHPSCHFTPPSEKANTNDLVHVHNCKIITASAAKT